MGIRISVNRSIKNFSSRIEFSKSHPNLRIGISSLQTINKLPKDGSKRYGTDRGKGNFSISFGKVQKRLRVLTLKAPLTRFATMQQNCEQSEICFFFTN